MVLDEKSANKDIPAITGENTESGFGVRGKSDLGVGVHGVNVGGNIGPDKGVGVYGESQHGFGVFASSDHHRGVRGVSKFSIGVNGISGAPAAIQPDHGCGVHGEAINGFGVLGVSDNFQGVRGSSNEGVGVFGASDRGKGVHGETHSTTVAAITALQLNRESTSTALYSEHVGGGLAGLFKGRVEVQGDVEVTGDIRLANADCAEDFNVAGAVKVEPGTVMVLGNEGALFESHQAYDKRVAGVISGAGDYKPGIVLDKQQATTGNRQPVALMGKVFCKVDAQFGAIEVGDLLTTSPTPGHAMKVDDPVKSLGAMIGKALSPLKEGQGMIPILIALQ